MKTHSSPAGPLQRSAIPLSKPLAILVFLATPSAMAATIAWNSGTTGLVGAFTTGSNWVGGVAPGSGDIAKIDNGGTTTGASTVTIGAGDTITVTTVDLGASNIANNRAIIVQSGGTLNTGTLAIGHAAYGASKSPEYRISGGALNIATAWTMGDGTAIKFTATGGTVTYTGGAWVVGNNGVAQAVTFSNAASLNYNSSSQITLGGTNSAGSGSLVLSNTASVTANSVATILMGNDGTRGNAITLSDSASFSAPSATLAMAQWNNGSATIPATAGGTITLGGTSYFNVSNLKTGGNNAANPQWGVVNLNGGTLETNAIQIGASSTTADANRNVVNANGGTVKAKSANANFFNGVFVNLLAGGLTFDTNGNAVTIVNVLGGAGGLTKKGLGTLTLSNSTLTYAGNTVVNEGTLALPAATFPDTANVSIATGGKISLGSGLEDQVGSLTLGGVAMPNGVYGSTASNAPLANQSDAFFAGTGTLRVGPPLAAPRQLVWQGVSSQNWITNETDLAFTVDGTPTGFRLYDNVTFADGPDATGRTINLSGALQPTSITVNNSTGNDYTLLGTGLIGGTTGMTKNGTGTLTFGGTGNSYTGAVVVNGGTVIMGSDTAFGSAPTIGIASGAQVDVSGKNPGPRHTYTIAGTGPGTSGALVNTGAQRNGGEAGVKNLILSADASVGGTGRFDLALGGTIIGNNHTLTKVGTNDMGFRGDASGSPIHIVIEGGTVWAETSAAAFGGATGTLVVKNGARAGTFGTLGISTPVSLESGATLHNQGAGTGTWSGAFTLAGEVGLDSTGGAMVITGAITGTANLTKTGANNVTVINPAWGGNTTVTGGQLTLAAATLGDASRVTLDGATSTLALTHGTSDTVGTLFLDGVQQAAGVYISTTNTEGISGAVATAHLVGNTGSLVVTTGPVVTPYGTWADSHITNPAYANLKGQQDDPDGDGFTNYKEFLFGSDPQSPAGPLVQVYPSGNTLYLYWLERLDQTYALTESTALSAGPWTASSVVPMVAGDQTGVPADYVLKLAAIPVDAPKKFLRVEVAGQ
ncbi:autotransporter-associated beta strand repeat-containing protein [Luteolibacter ambystomatis]|uniref:Autotransporter-associated beta strand repeat-containing protein n=1 Tax=Luteolibacter ambystomatis TaxID=2824561 RepID=A0A975G5B1_9BACT|nr:autotransporter-associated beta strand repeat-containing protein [Luteolibacter ambystomatis]QUE49374.1 autotransporter-associated beta strand repeat-containing protein [Luteolibacter ambystomatis]